MKKFIYFFVLTTSILVVFFAKNNFVRALSYLEIVVGQTEGMVLGENTSNFSNIWGYKVLMPGNQFNANSLSNLVITLDGESRAMENPFIFSKISSGAHTISVSKPAGWSVGYTLCYNETTCHTKRPIMENSVRVEAPAGGYADLWWHYFPPNITFGKIQGYKLDAQGNLFNEPGVTIIVDNEIFKNEVNPYSTTLVSGKYVVKSPVPNGYDVYHSVCQNCFNHPAGSYVKGSEVNVDVPAEGYVDLYWKYVSPQKSNIDFLPSSLNLTKLFAGDLFTEIYQGIPNIYAPEVLFENGIYKMWYGGGGADIKDRIHYAESVDGINWIKKGAVVEAPSPHFNANDPTVVKVGGKYYMYMTISESDLLDRIYLATSLDGLTWTMPIKVLEGGPYAWNSRYVARPTVIYDNGIFKMWYDTTSGTGYNYTVSSFDIGYATSNDGVNWQKHSIPVFNGYMAIDVKKYQSEYLMLIQGAWEGTHIATSPDGLNWNKKGIFVPVDSGDSTRVLGHITPFLFFDPSSGKPKAVYMGAGIPDGPNGYNRNGLYVYNLKVGDIEKYFSHKGSNFLPQNLVNSSSLKIETQPLSFSDGNWTYRVKWDRKLNRNASLYLGRYASLSDISSQGETQFIAPAGTRVKIEFYSQPNKRGKLLARKYFNIELGE